MADTIKVVFFDLYNTLATFEPPREELQTAACREFGVEVSPKSIRYGYWVADKFMSEENARSPVQKRSKAEARDFFAEYEAVLLKAAGVEVSRERASQIFGRLLQLERGLVLFDDALPTLDMLTSRGLILGLLSNIHRDVERLNDKLGISHYFALNFTSLDAGAEKPHPPIFLAALAQAGVRPHEALHVGDQYLSDVVGARGVGIKPLLLDRDGFWAEYRDCPRIRSLTEVVNYL